MNDFQSKLGFEERVFQQYDVEVEYEPLRLNENPSLNLTFPAGDISTKIQLFFAENEQHQLEGLIIQAEQYAKHNRLVLPFVATPIVSITNYNPFKVHFTGSSRIAGTFVMALMAKINPQKMKT